MCVCVYTHLILSACLCLSLPVQPIFQVHLLPSGHLFRHNRSRTYPFPSLTVADEQETPFSLPPFSFLYSAASFFPPQNWWRSAQRGQ